LPDTYLVDPERRLLFSFFIATVLSISAIPLVAKMLMDLNLLRTSVGQTILGSAIVNDLVGWILFAIILSMLNTATHGHGSVLGLVTLTVAFAAGCLTIGRKLVLAYLSILKARISRRKEFSASPFSLPFFALHSRNGSAFTRSSVRFWRVL
jgi:Kef-type K+ transport system membrane component KefB